MLAHAFLNTGKLKLLDQPESSDIEESG